jgi:hypothetical protein
MGCLKQGYPGRTHRFYNGSVVYPFGHGLSYTTFERELSVSFDHSVTHEQLAQWIVEWQYKPVGAPVVGTLSKPTLLVDGCCKADWML